MKKQNKVKTVSLLIFYVLIYPVTVLIFKLLPYILADDTNIELKSFTTNILTNIFGASQEILTSDFKGLFLITQVVLIFALYRFLNPKKRQPYEVVGKTNPVQGGAFWGKEKELDTLNQIHLVKEKSVKKHLLDSMKGASHE